MPDGMGREFAYLSSHATNRYFIPNWGKIIYLNGCDLRDKVWHDLQPNGFTEPRLFNAHAEHTRNRQTADESSLPV